jgi:hypothetical protein
VIHHLEKTEAGWRLRPDFSKIDTRLLFPQSMIALQAAADYLRGFFGAHLEELKEVFQRFDDLSRRASEVERAYELWIESSRDS